MKRMVLGQLLPALLVVLVAVAPASAGVINNAYGLSGDKPAQPIQAFDDGKWLYLQLRDPANPPAPVGPNGPVVYQMRGPYLVLPIMPLVTLRIGVYEAQVKAPGVGDVAPGIVSITTPIGLDLGSRPAPLATAKPTVSLGAERPTPGLMDGNEVRGEIVIDGPRGSNKETLGKGSKAPSEDQTVAFAEATEAGLYASSGQRLTLKADGSAAGAKAVLAARRVCAVAGRVCMIEYRGAPTGRIIISERVE